MLFLIILTCGLYSKNKALEVKLQKYTYIEINFSSEIQYLGY
jgi:hypothetical protein